MKKEKILKKFKTGIDDAILLIKERDNYKAIWELIYDGIYSEPQNWTIQKMAEMYKQKLFPQPGTVKDHWMAKHRAMANKIAK